MQDNSKYQELFLAEANEMLDQLDTGLIKLEKNPDDVDVQKSLMRSAHTLKGSSASMGYGDLSNLAHSFEGMVENIKNHLAKGGVDMLFGVVDELRNLVEATTSGVQKKEANPLVDQVGELEEEDLEQAGVVRDKPASFKSITAVKVAASKLDRLVDLVAETLIGKMQLDTSFEKAMKQRWSQPSLDAIKAVLEKQNSNLTEIQYQVLQLRLTALNQVFNRFPRMVRDLAKQEKKEVEFVVKGGEIELDRGILDSLGEPLVHLLRNAVDHGIQEKGTITLAAKRVQDSVHVTVHNDGGVNWEKVKEKVLQNDPSASTDAASLEQALFTGISTAEHVTEISGRGVGLAVVKNVAEKLRGRVNLESTEEAGTTFTLQLPLSVAIVRALIVNIKQQEFAVPLTSVERLLDLSSIKIQRQADQKVAVIDGDDVPLISLAKLFSIKEKPAQSTEDKAKKINPGGMIVLARQEDKTTGFVIDQVQAQQDIIVKPLETGTEQEQRFFSGVTILGDGQPVPIIDVNALIAHE